LIDLGTTFLQIPLDLLDRSSLGLLIDRKQQSAFFDILTLLEIHAINPSTHLGGDGLHVINFETVTFFLVGYFQR
jgi:hypothetical protein